MKGRENEEIDHHGIDGDGCVVGLLMASTSAAQQQVVMPIADSLSQIMTAVNVDSMRTAGDAQWQVLPAEVEIKLHLVATESSGGGWSIGILNFLELSSEGAEDTTYESNTLTVRFRNTAFAKSDELVFQTGTQTSDANAQAGPQGP